MHMLCEPTEPYQIRIRCLVCFPLTFLLSPASHLVHNVDNRIFSQSVDRFWIHHLSAVNHVHVSIVDCHVFQMSFCH